MVGKNLVCRLVAKDSGLWSTRPCFSLHIKAQYIKLDPLTNILWCNLKLRPMSRNYGNYIILLTYFTAPLNFCVNVFVFCYCSMLWDIYLLLVYFTFHVLNFPFWLWLTSCRYHRGKKVLLINSRSWWLDLIIIICLTLTNYVSFGTMAGMQLLLMVRWD